MADEIQGDPEVLEAGQIPAIWANRFNVVVFGDVTRISFKEAVHGVEGGGYRSSVMVRSGDALLLADLIKATIAAYQQQNPPAQKDG